MDYGFRDFCIIFGFMEAAHAALFTVAVRLFCFCFFTLEINEQSIGLPHHPQFFCLIFYWRNIALIPPIYIMIMNYSIICILIAKSMFKLYNASFK